MPLPREIVEVIKESDIRLDFKQRGTTTYHTTTNVDDDNDDKCNSWTWLGKMKEKYDPKHVSEPREKPHIARAENNEEARENQQRLMVKLLGPHRLEYKNWASLWRQLGATKCHQIEEQVNQIYSLGSG